MFKDPVWRPFAVTAAFGMTVKSPKGIVIVTVGDQVAGISR
jgi:hypothetical protein